MIGNIRDVFSSKPKLPPPTRPPSSIPMHTVHMVSKAATWFSFLSCFSLNFFLLLFSCLCTGILRMVLLFSLFFLVFCAVFPFACFFFCYAVWEKTGLDKDRLKRNRVYLSQRVCSRVDDVIVVLV